MQSKQYFTKIKNYPHEKSTEPEYSLLGFKVGHLFPAIKQVIDVTIHDIRQAVANLFGRPVPPF